jgi:pimeloyl-ACP methyl ester carboxylesterase
MNPLLQMLARILLTVFAVIASSSAIAQSEPIGIVIMHGKGGSPTRYVSDLASALENKGYLVANLEMPWSGRLMFSLPVSKAEAEVAAAVAALRAKGAKKIFIAGHSLGGVFTIHLAGKLAVDGVIAIAPGGDSANPVYRGYIAASISRARQLVAEGKGSEPVQLDDYEGGKGTYQINTVPAAFLTWYEMEGAMNLNRSTRAVNPQTPVLWLAPTRDYPGLLKSGSAYFSQLPSNPHTRLSRPDSDHLHAPAAAVDEIVRWTQEVAAAPQG